MKAYNNLSLAICLLLSVDSSKAIRQHLKSSDNNDQELVQQAKDAMAYNNAMLAGKKIVNAEDLPNQPLAPESDLELDPESPLFFAQSHDDQVRANKIREEQGLPHKKIDKDAIDTDYSEKPDGIQMTEQMRNVVSFVQLENDVQIKQENKSNETQKQKIEVKAVAKIENKTQQKTEQKQKTKQDVNGKLMLMLGGEGDVVPEAQPEAAEAKPEAPVEDKKEDTAKPQPEAPVEDKKAPTETTTEEKKPETPAADDTKATASAPVEEKKTDTKAPAAATDAPTAAADAPAAVADAPVADDKKAAADAPVDEKKPEGDAAPAEEKKEKPKSTIEANFKAIADPKKWAYQKKDSKPGFIAKENKPVEALAQDQSPLEKASQDNGSAELQTPTPDTVNENKVADTVAKEDKNTGAESKTSDKAGKKEDIDASAFDFTVTDDKQKAEDSKKSAAPQALVEAKAEPATSVETAPVVEAPKAETKIKAPAPVVAAPVKSKASDLIKKLKANAAAKLAKENLAKQIIKKTPPPVQEAAPQEQEATPVQISGKKAPKSSFVPFEVPKNLVKEMTPEEKAAKDKLENPTVDENGEHIQTVAEAKLEAAAMQNMLDEGVANVDKKIEERNLALAQEDALHKDEPVKQEEDDGHIETVEEVKAKMKALSENMNNDLAAVNSRADASQQEQASMPDMSALTTFTSTIHSMSGSQAKRQATLLASRLGVPLNAGEENMQVSELTAALVARAQQAGKSEQEIQEAISE